MSLPLNAIKSFEAAARHLSFARAAKSLISDTDTIRSLGREAKTDPFETLIFDLLTRPCLSPYPYQLNLIP